jgi:hypothetical protein
VRTGALDWKCGPQSLGLLQLQEDPQYRRIPPERQVLLVQAALEDGRGMARRLERRFGQDPAQIARKCNVAVKPCEGDGGFGAVIVYADYMPRPPCISLYLPAILRLDALIAQRGAELYFDFDSTLPIFLAHELYHHFDATRAGPPLSRQHPVRVFGLGAWHWTSGLASLAEIAAGSFAQHLLGLSFHPKLLDLYLLE